MKALIITSITLLVSFNASAYTASPPEWDGKYNPVRLTTDPMTQ
ncbi:hypothetical protein [Shewanella electrodiphila]|nr:hypothetical protein [Shewanella electrodiphila]